MSGHPDPVRPLFDDAIGYGSLGPQQQHAHPHAAAAAPGIRMVKPVGRTIEDRVYVDGEGGVNPRAARACQTAFATMPRHEDCLTTAPFPARIASDTSRPWPDRLTRAGAVALCIAAAVAGLTLGDAWARRHHPPGYVRLPTTFGVWDTEPASRHLFLSFFTPDDYAAGRVSDSVSTPWFLFQYALLKPLRTIGYAYDTAQYVVMLPTFAAILLLLWYSLDCPWPEREHRSAIDRAILVGGRATAVAALGAFPAFWVAACIGNPEDQNRFLATIAFCFLSVLDYRHQPLTRSGWLAVIGVSLLAPMYAPLLVLTMAILGISSGTTVEPSGLQWPQWRRQAALALSTAAVVIALPYAEVALSGFQGAGSGLLYRSGLDGSTEYFTNLLQAVIAPSVPQGRHWNMAAPVLALGGVLAMTLHSRLLAQRMLRQWLVASAAALFWVALFPQAVSIHPYLFDFGLLFPSAFCLVFWLCDRDIAAVLLRRRGVLLGIYVVLLGLLVTNATKMARLRFITPLV